MSKYPPLVRKDEKEDDEGVYQNLYFFERKGADRSPSFTVWSLPAFPLFFFFENQKQRDIGRRLAVIVITAVCNEEKSKNHVLAQALAKTRQTLWTSQTKVEEIEMALNEIKTRYQEEWEQLRQKECPGFEKKNGALEKTITGSEECIAALKEGVASLNGRVHEKENEMRKLEESLKLKDEEIRDLRLVLARKDQKTAHLHNVFAIEEARVQHLEERPREQEGHAATVGIVRQNAATLLDEKETRWCAVYQQKEAAVLALQRAMEKMNQRAQANQARVQELEELVRSQVDETHRSTRAMETDEVQKVKIEVQRVEQKMKLLEIKMEEQGVGIGTLQRFLQTQEHRLRELKREVEEKDQTMLELELKLGRTEAKLELFQHELQQKIEEVAAWKKTVDCEEVRLVDEHRATEEVDHRVHEAELEIQRLQWQYQDAVLHWTWLVGKNEAACSAKDQYIRELERSLGEKHQQFDKLARDKAILDAAYQSLGFQLEKVAVSGGLPGNTPSTSRFPSPSSPPALMLFYMRTDLDCVFI